ncbi:MAG: DMT family transporter [Burkholderiaceae bacterium]
MRSDRGLSTPGNAVNVPGIGAAGGPSVAVPGSGPSSGPAVAYAPSGGMAGGVAMLLLTMLIWGTQFPIAKSAFEHLDSFHTAAFRYGVGVCGLLLMLLIREGWTVLRFDRQGRDAALIGLIGMFGSPALVFTGLMFSRPEIAAILVAVQPALTALVTWLVRGRRPAPFSLLCIVVAFIGVVTAVTRWDPTLLTASPTELSGNILIFAGCLCWVFYTVASEDFRSWSVLRLTTLTMLSGTLGHFALVIVLTVTGAVVSPGLADWMAARNELLFLAIAGVLVAMVCWNSGTQRIGPLNAMLFTNLIPVITFGVRFMQGYRFHWLELVGAALVIIALIANNIAMRRTANRSARLATSGFVNQGAADKVKSAQADGPGPRSKEFVLPITDTRIRTAT